MKDCEPKENARMPDTVQSCRNTKRAGKALSEVSNADKLAIRRRQTVEVGNTDKFGRRESKRLKGLNSKNLPERFNTVSLVSRQECMQGEVRTWGRIEGFADATTRRNHSGDKKWDVSNWQ